MTRRGVPNFSVNPVNKIDAYFRLHDLVHYDLTTTKLGGALLAQNLLTCPIMKCRARTTFFLRARSWR